MDPKVSIVIPVYNAAKTLRRCVESLVLGLEREIEVILCEDCSRDGSWTLCQELAAEFNNVKCIRNEKNSGVSYTRNMGLQNVRGEYVLFVDSDDWVSGRYVQQLLRLAQENQDALPICGHHFIDKVNGTKHDYLWDADIGTAFTIEPGAFFDLCDRFLLQQLWNKIFRRDVIEAHNIRFDETQNMGEDFQFVLDYMEAINCQKCIVLNEALYYYIRWNNASLMSKFGFINNQPEFDRMTQLARLAGSGADARKDAMIAQSKQNYVYHIVRNKSHLKQEKLDAIERIMGDGKATTYYREQKLLHTKEQIASLIGGAKNLYPRLKGRLQRTQLQKTIDRATQDVNAQNVTFISQNCIGGVLYHDLGMQFLSPTINTFIPEPDFVKFVLNLRYYMEQELIMRWEEEYPVGMLGDVEIRFMHYETCKEAKESWDKRKARINWNKILILCTDRDGFDAAVYAQWEQIKYPKVLFTAHAEFTEDAVYYSEYEADGQIGDLIPGRAFYKTERLCPRLMAGDNVIIGNQGDTP